MLDSLTPEAKIDLLRKLMQVENLEAYIVPSWDEFQGEYIADHSKRLEYITNFSGSNGLFFISQDIAVLFTDGRYYLQARQQILDGIQIIDINELPQWLQKWTSFATAPKAVNLGYDANLFTPAQLDNYCRLILGSKTNFILRPLVNLIDRIWHNKPIFHAGAPYLYCSAYDYRQKIAIITALVEERGCEALFIADPHNLAWLLNIRGSDLEFTPIIQAVALLETNGCIKIFCQHASRLDILSQWFDLDIETYEYGQMPIILNQYADKKIWLDRKQTSLAINSLLQNKYYDLDPITLQKALKTPAELEAIRAIAKLDCSAIAAVINYIKDCSFNNIAISEVSIAAKLLEVRQQKPGFICHSFAPIVGFGANSAIIHYHPQQENPVPIGKRGLILIDSGGQYQGGTTDVTRVVAIGDPTTAEKIAYSLVLKGHIALARAVFPIGTNGSQLDALARQYLWQYGYDYQHGTGHGVGACLSVHEGPHSISKHNSQPLMPGMLVTNEPGVYFEGEFGIRIENIMTIIEIDNSRLKSKNAAPMLGFEILTFVAFEEKLLQKDMLTSIELAWLEQYKQSCINI